MKRFILSFVLFVASLALAQPPPPTTSPLTVTTATSAITGPGNATRFASANSLLTSASPTSPFSVSGSTLQQLTPPGVRGAWQKLYNISTGTTAQLRILLWGDSMVAGAAGVDMKPNFYVPLMESAYGVAGQPDRLIGQVTGGASYSTGNFTQSPSGELFSTPAAGTITWGGGPSGDWSIKSDTLMIFYVKESGAGTFKVQSSNDGASFVDEAGYTNVDANNASTILGVITITKTEAPYRIRVVGLTGTVRFNYALMRDTAAKGVEVYRIASGGIGLDQMLTNQTLVGQFIAALAPDLVHFEMKDSSSIFTTNLPIFQSLFTTNAPSAEFIFCGSTPQATGDADQFAQNIILQNHASTYNKYYFDGYSPIGSYAELVAAGWDNGDGTHTSSGCQSYLAGMLMRQSTLLNAVGHVAQNGLTTQLAFPSSLGAGLPKVTHESIYSGKPAVGYYSPDGSGKYFSAHTYQQGSSNRGLVVEVARASSYTGSATYDPVAEFATQNGFGTGAVTLALGGKTPDGTGLLQFPATGSTALANGMSWGSTGSLYLDTNSAIHGSGTWTFDGLLSSSNTTSASSATAGAFVVGNGTALTSVAVGGGIVRAGQNIYSGGTVISNLDTSSVTGSGFRSRNDSTGPNIALESQGASKFPSIIFLGVSGGERGRVFVNTNAGTGMIFRAEGSTGTDTTMGSTSWTFGTAQVLKAGSAGTTLTDSAGKILSAALNTVAVAQGGTGAVTLTGLVKGNGTSAMTAAVAGTDYVAPGGAGSFTTVTASSYVKLPSYVVSGLPSAATAGAGAMAYVTDSTATAITGLGLAVIGSGSNKVVVVSDGTNWIVQ